MPWGVAAAVVGSVISTQINGAISGGGGGGGGGSSTSAGGGVSMTPQQQAYYNNSYFYQGINEGQSKPGIGGSQEQSVAGLPNEGRVTASRPVGDTGKAEAANPRATPTQGASEEASNAQADFKNQWADHLSKYLNYNTRDLG